MARFPINMNTEYSITIVAVNRVGNSSSTLTMNIPTTGLFYFMLYIYMYCTYISYCLNALIVRVAVVFGINYTSNAGQKLVIVRAERYYYYYYYFSRLALSLGHLYMVAK